jgi:hypothetical protein
MGGGVSRWRRQRERQRQRHGAACANANPLDMIRRDSPGGIDAQAQAATAG